MTDELHSLHDALRRWAAEAKSRNWLSQRAFDMLASQAPATAGSLFDRPDRPLVAGLFGGTGVGKSSLLNRLAGADIARTSAERPTSRDITVYVHRSVTVDRLPEAFPLQHMKTSLHQNREFRHVMWIDMPDFDSVESANRDLVNLWMPHLDVVLYVVSPERYRDDQGWRLLLEHGAAHAWIFVFNHWDRGSEEQIADFRQLLVAAGLTDPIILRTDSSGSPANGAGVVSDDVAELEALIESLADNRLITELEARGVRQRIASLREASESMRTALADPARLQELPASWQAYWTTERDDLERSLAHRLPGIAANEASEERGWFATVTGGFFRRITGRRLPGGTSEQPSDNAAHPSHPVFDDSLLARVDDVIERFLQQSDHAHALPLAVGQRALLPVRESLPQETQRRLSDALWASLMQPGSRLQRAVARALGLLTALLPALALVWIAWRAFDGFRLGGSDPAAYLGSNFAVNGILLLIVAWVVPSLLHHWLRPSREKAALRGLQQGVTEALDKIGQAVEKPLAELTTEHQMLVQDLAEVWTRPENSLTSTALPERVRRMLLDDHRTEAVRATTQSSTDAAPVS